MPAADIAIRSPVATAISTKNASNIRVYFLTSDGDVREVIHQGSWSGGQAANKVGDLKPTSSLTAASQGDLEYIRLYGVGSDNKLKEIAHDAGGQWHNGGLTGKYDVAPYSGVAAVFLNDKLRIRVYAQLPNDSIQEFCWDNNSKNWFSGGNLGPALPGTDIAAVTWGDGSQEGIRVYFQSTNGTIVEQAHDAGKDWYFGGLKIEVKVPFTSLAALVWTTSSGTPDGIRVYYDAVGDQVKEKAWDRNGSKWVDGAFLQPSIPATRIAALSRGGADLRVYLQNGTKNTAFTEFAFSRSGWVVGQQALPPA